jgi:molybdate transport system regulatory protein
LIFLLIRYTGARLNEVLQLDLHRDIDYRSHTVRLHKSGSERNRSCREVEIPEVLSSEIRQALDAPEFASARGDIFRVDPAHVRRKFYELAAKSGVPRGLGAPDAIRRSRAVELLQNNVPLPVVQKILGHSTPNLAASYVEFSDEEMRRVARFFVDKENQRKTSARNSFFGKVSQIRRGDVQAIIEIASLGGYCIHAVITENSLSRLGLKPGTLVAAEVKAPWVMLYRGAAQPNCTAENKFAGTVHQVTSGSIMAEIVVRIPDGTELCSVVTEESRRRLDIHEDDPLWVAFDASAVILHVD